MPSADVPSTGGSATHLPSTDPPDRSPRPFTVDDVTAGPGLPVPTGRDAAWTVLGGLGGMLVGLVAGLVPALLLGGTDLVALGLLTSVLGGTAGLWFALRRPGR